MMMPAKPDNPAPKPKPERLIVTEMKEQLDTLEQRMKDDELHIRFLTIKNKKDKADHARLVLRIQSAENSDGL
jgi:hypothetical protein